MAERIQNVQHTATYKGKRYRSKLEIETAMALEAINVPFRYEERKITLMDGFRTPYQKEKIRQITYTPDFEIGSIMIECKGFETPEWKIKKKLIFKYLMENEPDTMFYQIHDSKKQLLEVLDAHWDYLGYNIQVKSKGKKKEPSTTQLFESVQEALHELNLKGKALGPIMSCLAGKKEWVYGYNWSLKEINDRLKWK